MDVFYVKFVGTTSSLSDYDAMVAATTLDVDRWEIELACLWIVPSPIAEGEGGTTWGESLWKARRRRRQFEVEFYPFSNHEAVSTTVLQNTDNLLTLEEIIVRPYVWIAEPTTGALALPPRYVDGANFPKTVLLLPARVECDDPAYSKTDEGTTEATMVAIRREM